jgi:hypothetical protein
VELDMAHYAFLDESNTVVEVIVGRDEGDGGVDWEQHYAEVRGLRCLRTSYNTQGGLHLLGGTPYRLNYAGIGYQYREDMDGFVPPCPGEDFTLDETTGDWLSPE